VLASEPRRAGWFDFFWRPVPVAAFATFAVAVIGISVLRHQRESQQPAAVPFAISKAPLEEPVAAPPSAPPAKPTPPAARARVPASASRQREGETPPPVPEASAGQPASPPSPEESRREAEPAPPLAADVSLAEKKEVLAKAKTAPASSLRYWIEREQAAGDWVEFGAELTTGDRVRLRVEPARDGYLTLDQPTGRTTQPAQTGRPVYFPLDSASGERMVALSWTKSPPLPPRFGLPNSAGFRGRAPSAAGAPGGAEADESQAANERIEIRLSFK
jgi:hypothetical protein